MGGGSWPCVWDEGLTSSSGGLSNGSGHFVFSLVFKKIIIVSI